MGNCCGFPKSEYYEPIGNLDEYYQDYEDNEDYEIREERNNYLKSRIGILI